MKYIHHTNNIIDIAASVLPRAYGNTSGLNHASPEELKALGWLPVVLTNPPFDSETQVRTGPIGGQVGDVVTGNADSVDVIFSVRDKTAQELDDEKDAEAGQQLKTLKALGLALNDGSFVPGSNYTNTQLKAIIKAKL